MAEDVWLEKAESEALPVVIKTESVVRKTGVNDKALIQYGLDFEYAFSKINNIR